MKKILIIFILSNLTHWTNAQQVANVKNSWLGNSNADQDTYMPQGLEGMCVSKDGTVYTNVPWEEGGHSYTEIKNGIVKHGAESLGWGAFGGSDATVNSQYVYFSTSKGSEGGALSGPDYPPAGKSWNGILRISKADFKKGAPFVGGKGTGGIPNSMLVVYELDDKVNVYISGIYASEKELIVSIASHNIVKVYDATTMVFKREFSIANPHQIGMDSYGNLWIAQGHDATKIKRYSPTGTLLPEAVNLPEGSFVGDFCLDKNDRILIGDVGKREQVIIYTNINSKPELTATFGALNGIHSGISGRNEPLKFQQIRGIGVDTLGNIYIGNTQWHTGGEGAIVEKYNMATGQMDWKRYCVMFVDGMGIDAATDGRDVFGKVEHFTIDYTKSAGEDGKYSAYTIDRYKYPADPRLHEQFASVLVKNIKGQKFLAMSSMNGGLGAIFRFTPATDGDIAIPCIVFGSGKTLTYPGSINGEWMWRDLNGNGQMETGEYTEQAKYYIDGGYGAHMDDNGDIWQAGDKNILHTKCLGLDANNIPLYNGSYTLIPAPEPFNQVKRAYYDVKLDRMYLAGGTKTQPTVDSWQSMGRAINRYDNWSKGNRTASIAELVLPAVTTNGFTVPISFKVVDEYIFVGFLGGEATIPRLQLNIYKVSDNSSVGYIRAPWKGVGLFDMIQSIDGYKRKNGEYVIIVEEDGRNKNVMYRWTPGGNVVETTDKLSADINYLKFLPTENSQKLTVTSNIGWTIKDLPTWLTISTPNGTGNGVVTLNASANTGTTSRTATITLSGGAVTNQITVFQEVKDVAAPSEVAGLVASMVTPFSFQLNWAGSADNVMVTGYEIFKDGVLYKSIPSSTLGLTGLTPNTAYTMMVKAFDAAGNKTAGTTLVVKTLQVTYPYITSLAYANYDTDQRAFDNNMGTQWMDWSGKNWIQIQYENPVAYNKYTIVSVGDVPNRNPKDWTLKGSNDGENWTDLSEQVDQNWGAERSNVYYFVNATAYSYYRLDIHESLNGIAIAELIYGNGAGGTIIDDEKPSVPISLSASNTSSTTTTLDWVASIDNVGVAGYEVFKNGVSIGTTSTTDMLATGLNCNTSYTFSVKAKDAKGNISDASVELKMISGSCSLATTESDATLNQYSLHPNPANNELFVSGNILENARYQITSIEGKALQTGALNGSSINIGNLSTGIYLIKIKTEVGDRVQRFVKE